MERITRALKPATRISGVGCCIYCRRTGDKLTDEHVVPFSLGGNLVLEKSSCLICAKATSRNERIVLRDFFGPFREALNFPTRRPARRPSEIELITSVGEDKAVSRMVPWHKYPAALGLLDISRPTYMDALPFTGSATLGVWSGHFGNNRAPGMTLGKAIKIDDYLAFLAKVAHSAAICLLRERALEFTWFLPPLILGENELQFHYVGGNYGEPYSPMSPQVYGPNETKFPTSFALHSQLRHGLEIVTVELQIFSDIPTPRYFAVFGARTCLNGVQRVTSSLGLDT